jgi:hypothetical protein
MTFIEFSVNVKQVNLWTVRTTWLAKLNFNMKQENIYCVDTVGFGLYRDRSETVIIRA